MVHMRINMNLKTNEIPTFAEGTAVVITLFIFEGRQTVAFCLALTVQWQTQIMSILKINLFWVCLVHR
jgi:hypothetical protein